jgi:MarR family multiple antibiotic resistance transcriptional regulator
MGLLSQNYIPWNMLPTIAVVRDMDLFDQLVRFETGFWNAIERHLSRNNQVGLATLQALRVLDRHGGQGRVHELSDELLITIGAASKLVDRLERDGLALRRAHPDDRRSSLISLTAAGQQARRNAEQLAEDFIARVLGDLQDVERLTEALRRLQLRLDHSAAEVTR